MNRNEMTFSPFFSRSGPCRDFDSQSSIEGVSPPRSVEANGWVHDRAVDGQELERAGLETGFGDPERDCLFAWARDGEDLRFIGFSRASEAVLGPGIRAFLGMNVRELYGGRPGLSDILRACLDDPVPHFWEGWYTFHSDSLTRYVSARCVFAPPRLVIMGGVDKTNEVLNSSDALSAPRQEPVGVGEVFGAGPPGLFVFTAYSGERIRLNYLNHRALFLLGASEPESCRFPDALLGLLCPEARSGLLEAFREAVFWNRPLTWMGALASRPASMLALEAWPEAAAEPGLRYLGTLRIVDLERRRQGALRLEAHDFEARERAALRRDPWEDLSRREKEVAERILTGASNAEIAASLFVEETTIKKHVTSIYSKLGVENRIDFFLRYGHSKK